MSEATTIDNARPTPGGGGSGDSHGESDGRHRRAESGSNERARMGRNDEGTVSISDAAVTKLVAHAAAVHPDAGAAAARLLGRAVPGAGHLGVRGTDLDALPKTSVEVDRSTAFVHLELAVRWPCSVPEVAAAVRERVRTCLEDFVGLSVGEVHVVVAELVTDLAAPPRVN